MAFCPLCKAELVGEKCPNGHALYWRQGQPDAEMTRILNAPFDELPPGVQEMILAWREEDQE